jgi:predicted anti-sigma-YlaC factor YlaD
MATHNKPNSFSHLSSDQLLRYHRRTLTPGELSVVESHLKACELCSDALKGVAEMNDALKIYSITHELKKRIRNRSSSRKNIFSRNYLISVIAVAFMLGLVIIVALFLLYFRMK